MTHYKCKHRHETKKSKRKNGALHRVTKPYRGKTPHHQCLTKTVTQILISYKPKLIKDLRQVVILNRHHKLKNLIWPSFSNHNRVQASTTRRTKIDKRQFWRRAETGLQLMRSTSTFPRRVQVLMKT